MLFALWNPASPSPGTLRFDVTSREGGDLGRPGLPWFTACARAFGLATGVRSATVERARGGWWSDDPDAADWRERWPRVWSIHLELDDRSAQLAPQPVLERVVCPLDDPGRVDGAWADAGSDDRGFSARARTHDGGVLLVGGFSFPDDTSAERVSSVLSVAAARALPDRAVTLETLAFAPAAEPPSADDLAYYDELGEDGRRFLAQHLARSRPLRLVCLRIADVRLPRDEAALRTIREAMAAEGGIVRRHGLA